jgi:hypothetical protein
MQGLTARQIVCAVTQPLVPLSTPLALSAPCFLLAKSLIFPVSNGPCEVSRRRSARLILEINSCLQPLLGVATFSVLRAKHHDINYVSTSYQPSLMACQRLMTRPATPAYPGYTCIISISIVNISMYTSIFTISFNVH